MTENYKNCIYKFTFPNGRSYIGQTTDYNTRMKNHKNNAKTDPNRNVKLYSAINETGWENVQKEILLHDVPKDMLTKLEAFFIDEYDTFKNGYNNTPGHIFKTLVSPFESAIIFTISTLEILPEEELNKLNIAWYKEKFAYLFEEIRTIMQTYNVMGKIGVRDKCVTFHYTNSDESYFNITISSNRPRFIQSALSDVWRANIYVFHNYS